MELVLKTAPDITPYEELDISDDHAPKILSPQSRDIILDLYKGNQQLIKRSLRSKFQLKAQGVSSATIQQYMNWQQERIRLRINGNYGSRTIFYQTFRRANANDNSLGVQIGTEPTFDRDVTSTDGEATYLADDGKFHVVSDDVPRYEGSCFGGKGLLIEGESRNYMAYSHPQSGLLLWGAFLGTPTISWSAAFESIVDGMAGGAYCNIPNGEKVYHTSSIVQSTETHSYFVYLRGWGTVRVQAYKNGLTYLTQSQGIVLSPDEYTRIELRGISLANGDYVYMVIEALADTNVWIFNDQLEPRPHHTSYIHNVATGQYTVREMDKIELTNVNNLTGAGTFSLGVLFPGYSIPTFGPPYYWYLSDSPETFKLYYDVANLKTYFQKKSASYKAEFLHAPTADSELIVTGCYDNDYIKLYIDGDEKDSMGNFPVHSVGSTFHIGAATSKDAITNPVAFLRIDDIRLSSAEILSMANMYLDADSLIWTNFGEGRDFRIIKMTTPLRVGPGTWDSTIVFGEVQAEETATTRSR